MDRLKQLNKRQLVYVSLAIGVLAGMLIFISLRFAFAKSNHPHYHANFGLFIDGKRDNFENFTFYEEVQSCSADHVNNPKSRVHLHNQESDTIHVHDAAATWNHFFNNLGYNLGYNSVSTGRDIYVDGQNGKQLTFILNGQEIDSAYNRVIGNEDVLLISYGDPKQAKDEYSQITKTATEYNHKPDPATCSTNGELTIIDRLKHSISLRN